MKLTTPPRLASLDLLRAVAVLLVLGRHLAEATVAALPGPLRGFFAAWQRGGWIGVDLFFVLSGFLIAGLLFREQQRFGSIRYGRFLARRGFKIYPAFYAMLATVLGIALAYGRPLPAARVLWSEMLFVQNYGPSLFPHSWSLAVEEHFYLLLPLLLIALSRQRGAPFAALPGLFAVVAILSLAARLATDAWVEFAHKTHVFATHLRLDSLCFGVLLSWLWHYHRERLTDFVKRSRWPLGFAAFALALPPFFFEITDPEHPALHTFGFTALYLSAGITLLLALRLPSVWRPLAGLGAYSYSIYLWHLPVRFYGEAWLPRDLPPLLSVALYFSLSIGVGIVAAKLIETPFLRLRERWWPARNAGLSSPVERSAPGWKARRHDCLPSRSLAPEV